MNRYAVYEVTHDLSLYTFTTDPCSENSSLGDTPRAETFLVRSERPIKRNTSLREIPSSAAHPAKRLSLRAPPTHRVPVKSRTLPAGSPREQNPHTSRIYTKSRAQVARLQAVRIYSEITSTTLRSRRVPNFTVPSTRAKRV